MTTNFSKSKTLEPDNNWINRKENERIEIVEKELKKEDKYKKIDVLKAQEDGQVILKIEYTIPSNERGLFLLELEEKLKLNIDEGINIWLEPVGDKSKLRQLRGVKIKT